MFISGNSDIADMEVVETPRRMWIKRGRCRLYMSMKVITVTCSHGAGIRASCEGEDEGDSCDHRDDRRSVTPFYYEDFLCDESQPPFD